MTSMSAAFGALAHQLPSPRAALDGEQRLREALATDRSHQRSRPAGQLRRLARHLRAGDVAIAEAQMLLLWRQSGLAAAHAGLATCLRETDLRLADGTSTLHETLRTHHTAYAALERLRATTATPKATGRVILAVPQGDGHTLALTALAHLVQEVGLLPLVVDDLPAHEIGTVAARPDTVAVAVSAHLPWPITAARRFVTAIREQAPDVLIVLGGIGCPTAVPPADLVTNDATQLAQALRSHGSVLTPREFQVLQAIADGLGNNRIADDLGIAPSTVKSHLENVYAKTQTTHRAAAVAHSLRKGWIT